MALARMDKNGKRLIDCPDGIQKTQNAKSELDRTKSVILEIEERRKPGH